MSASVHRLEALRRRLASLEDGRRGDVHRFDFGCPALDQGLGAQGAGALHELYAETDADAPAMTAFALGLAARAARGRPIVWSLQDMTARETGEPYGLGLAELGIDPEAVLMVRVRHAADLLAVGEEALRHGGVGAVVLSAWGEAKAFTLTASRRLALAARDGTTAFLARASAQPSPGAAESRWIVRSAPSTPLEAGAPGRPAFSATLSRHRRGGEPRTWNLEWDREQRSFVEPAPLSGGVASVSADRADQGLRRAG